MKTLALSALVFALSATSALAASPHDGTWVSVEEKSSWSDGKFPKGFKLAITLKFDDNKLEYSSVNTTRPETPYRTNYVATLDSKPAPLNEQARFNNVRVRKLTADEFEILKMKDQDVIVGEYWRFLPDGQTLVRRGIAKSPEGVSRAYDEYFVRAK